MAQPGTQAEGATHKQYGGHTWSSIQFSYFENTEAYKGYLLFPFSGCHHS